MSPSSPKAGVMGWPVSHSLSPRLHGFWLQKYGIEGSYEALPVPPQDLEKSLRNLAAQGLRGVNLTVPHKEAACKIVDDLEPTAERIGAVNLVTIEADGRLLGRNTDAYGFTQNLLKGGFKPQGGVAFMLGAGGAARAVTVALSDMGFSEIRIANRSKDRAEKLAAAFSTVACKISVVDWQEAPRHLADAEILINTTSLGMTGQPALAFPLDPLPQAAFVTDLVYTPLQTDLLRHATQRRHRTIDGLGMLLHQARPSFEAFFGQDPDVTEELRHAVLGGTK